MVTREAEQDIVPKGSDPLFTHVRSSSRHSVQPLPLHPPRRANPDRSRRLERQAHESARVQIELTEASLLQA